MLLLAAMFAATSPPQPARVSVRIMHAQQVSESEWGKAARRREVLRLEGNRRVKLRLIEFE